MMYPRLLIDLGKLRHNGEALCRLAAERGVADLAFVTKVFCADGEIARTLAETPCRYLADSRIENLEKLAGLGKDRILLRLPMPSQAEAVVRSAEISFNSEPATLGALSAAAEKAGKIHRVVLMIDLGDLREGIFFENREAVFAAAEQVEADPWLELRNQLDGAAAAPLRPGETPLPLAQLRGLAASPQRETRRLAYEAEQRLYPTYAVPMAACFNGIKGEALTELSWKAYSSVEAEMLDINKISAQTLQSMFAAIEGHLPHFRRYLRQKAAALGCPNGLPWYDLLAPMEGIPAGFSFAQASEMLVGALDSFSPEIGALARRALDNGWIDALPAAGKQGGAICVDLPARRENRVLLSYSGTFRCIRTMAHELGHAYHARCLDAIPLLLRDAPTPICETASLMNEVVFQSKTLEQLPAQQRFPLLECDLQECTQTVLDIYSRYLFEREVFALRAQRELLPQDFCRLMTDAQKAVFGDALDPQALHPYMWMCKVHYYIPEYHYYNYPYIFGLLLAKGLYARYLAQPDGFPQAYRQLLAATCSGSMEDIAAKAGVDIRSQAFWDSALDLIVKDIDAWISWSREGGGSFS